MLDSGANSKPEDLEWQFVILIHSELQDLKRAVLNRLVQAKAGKLSSREELERFLEDGIYEVIRIAHANRIPSFLEDVSLDSFTERYGMTTDYLVDSILLSSRQGLIGNTVDNKLRARFHEMAYSLVRSTKKSQMSTGLVFAGFGQNDRFPSLHSVEIDGTYFDRVRIVEEQKEDIDRRDKTSAIVPFAQKDMPERFMFGIDQDFEKNMGKIVADLTAQVLGQTLDSDDEVERNRIVATANNVFTNNIKKLKNNSATELLSVVKYLSKKDLGEVAFLLVEMTSRKRRYSNQLETVGGPVDVAILTRHEGFMWVRRNHYFSIDLNPNYKQRLALPCHDNCAWQQVMSRAAMRAFGRP